MSSRSDIKHTIDRIIETDKKAREATAQVRENAANADAMIGQRVSAVREEYMSRALRRVEIIRKAEQGYAEDEWKKVEKDYIRLEAKLDEQYAENGDKWVDDLVNCVIGGNE